MAIDQTPEWLALEEHAARLRAAHLRDLFADDPHRAERLTFPLGDLIVDVSKQRITVETLDLLVALAERAGVPAARDRQLAGERVNVTEDRSVLHTALRTPRDARLLVDGNDVVADVHAVLERMAAFAERVRSGAWTGATGRPIRNVVNIGIGGSDLGPRMAYTALRSWTDRSRTFRFVSNVDGSDLVEATLDLDPAETLFIVASKTFTTLETMTNARSARAWLVAALGEDAVQHHFVAVSTNAAEVSAFGIDTGNMFGFWDWVGGRYSMDSAIGLSLVIALGPDRFAELLRGFRAVDEHWADEPLPTNVPVLVALLGVWERNFLGSPSYAVVPYCQELDLFPSYLQQLDMESNGKRVRTDGSGAGYDTGPIVWGTPGTNGQHAYFQLLHQGTTVVPVDLIGFCHPVHTLGDHHDLLIANLLAQSAALAFGRDAEEVTAEGIPARLVPHRTFPGNRPSTVILGERLSPFALGELVALYEHRVATQGYLWGIDSFDQWGVELGKKLANGIAPDLTAPEAPTTARHDQSTDALVRHYRARRLRPA